MMRKRAAKLGENASWSSRVWKAASPEMRWGQPRTQEYVRQRYSLMLFDNPNQRKTAMEPEGLLLNRLRWGLDSVLSKLGATSTGPDHFRAAVESPPIGQRATAARPETAHRASL